MSGWLENSRQRRDDEGLKFWIEALLVGAIYFAYGMVRNLFGSAAVDPQEAARNADLVIDIEEALGLYIEADVQELFIDYTAFIQFWNLFYGAFHFLVTFVALIWLYLAFPERYRFWRRAGLLATASAVVGYATFPLMPPRLLGECESAYGACRPDERYVDTVVDIGGIWSFESSGFEAISNQYAAMPSLHIGWALWCALILVPRLRRWWTKALAATYPLMTLFAIVVTANHYWIDALGGVAVVLFGVGVSQLWETSRFRRLRPPLDSGSDDLATTVDSGVA